MSIWQTVGKILSFIFPLPHKFLHRFFLPVSQIWPCNRKTHQYQLIRLPDLDFSDNFTLKTTLKPSALENINKVVSAPGLSRIQLKAGTVPGFESWEKSFLLPQIFGRQCEKDGDFVSHWLEKNVICSWKLPDIEVFEGI